MGASARELLKRDPLVGLTATAKRLQVARPNARKAMAARGVEAIAVEGSAGVYLLSEVAAVAEELRSARAKRDGGG